MAKFRPVGDWIAGRFEIFAVHPGGMGVVYVAHDLFGPPGRKVVAIKTLRDEWLADSDWSARFAAECELWVRVGSHPNIVEAYAVESLEGKPHILLELVTGGDLRRWIGTPELDAARALHLGVQFCLGMEHATRQGLRCHRDVKPGNLLLAADGTLKITDFGLAVIRDELYAEVPAHPADGSIPLADGLDDPPPRPPSDPASGPADVSETIDHAPGIHEPGETPHLRLTQTGSLLGTLPYMAPEQFRDAKGVDVRADVYAFGIVLFQMLTGELPFRGGTLARYDRAHSRYAPPSVIAAIPKKFAREAGAIDEIVQRCLKKDPAERYASMDELRKALTHPLRRLDPLFDPTLPRRVFA